MDLLLIDGKKIDVGVPDQYEMQLSRGFNQSIWQLSDLKETVKYNMVTNLMAVAVGQGAPKSQEEIALLPLMRLVYHIEWLAGMLANPDGHRVCAENPDEMLESFKAFCRLGAQIDEGQSGKMLQRALRRAAQNMERARNPAPAPASMFDSNTAYGSTQFNYGFSTPGPTQPLGDK